MFFFRQQIDLKTEVGGRIFHNIYFEGGRLRDKEKERIRNSFFVLLNISFYSQGGSNHLFH